MDKSDLERRLRDEFCDESCIGHERGCDGCPIADALEHITQLEAENKDMSEYIQQHIAAEYGACSLPDAKRIVELQTLVDKLDKLCEDSRTARGLLREILTTADPGRCARCGCSLCTRTDCRWRSVRQRALEFLGTGVSVARRDANQTYSTHLPEEAEKHVQEA